VATNEDDEPVRRRGALGYLRSRPLETGTLVVAIVSLILAWRLDAIVDSIQAAAQAATQAVQHLINPVGPNQEPTRLSQLEVALKGFDNTEGDFHVRLATLQDPGTTAQNFTSAKTAAGADMDNCAAFLRGLRRLDPKQEPRWKGFEAKIAADLQSLARIPDRNETFDSRMAAYSDALTNFNSEFTAGDTLLESVDEGGGIAKYHAIDQDFVAAERALVNQRIALGRLEYADPSRNDMWNADRHAIETETDLLDHDWKLVEVHDSGDATAPYQN
jgi:hypothetical protein